jgi:hypothetical protein
VLRVELGRGTGGMRKDAGVRIEVVTLLNDLEDVDMGVGNGEGVTLDAVVVVRDDTEDTVVDFGWRLAELLLEIDRGEEGCLWVVMGLAVTDLLAIDMVRDCIGITLLSEDKVAEVTLILLTASGIVPTTEGVGVPRYDFTIGVDTDGVDTWLLDGRDDGKGGRDDDWAGDSTRGTVAYSVELGHLIALEYSVKLSMRSGVVYWDSSVSIDDMD